jgi:hypothetical protein
MTKQPNTKRRKRTTTDPAKPPGADAPEGERAKWWRERIMGLSRPALAEQLGVHPATIDRQERSATVDSVYRLACAAVANEQAEWCWSRVRGD